MTRATMALVLGSLALSSAAFADRKTVTLVVPGMNCAACPITVKKALEGADGVEKVTVTYEPKEAVVTFDDSRTSVARLQEATKKAGYPSAPKSGSAAPK